MGKIISNLVKGRQSKVQDKALFLVVLRKCYYFDHCQTTNKQTKTNTPPPKKIVLVKSENRSCEPLILFCFCFSLHCYSPY